MQLKKQHIIPTLSILVAVILAAALKYHYHHASSRELGWVLGPTVALVTAVTGVEFVFEPGAGWISLQERLIIARSCAGINFLIVCFLSLTVLAATESQGRRFHPAWLPATFCFAYGSTLAVNALRITAAIFIARTNLLSEWIDAESLHRLEGVAIYLMGLGVTAKVWQILLRLLSGPPRVDRDRKCRLSSRLIPAGIYLLVVVGLPFTRGLFHGLSADFGNHVLTVMGVGAVVWGVPFLLKE
jgi:exosortase K